MKNLRKSDEDAADPVRTEYGSDDVRLSKVRSARKALQASHYENDDILNETASRVCAEIESEPSRRTSG